MHLPQDEWLLLMPCVMPGVPRAASTKGHGISAAAEADVEQASFQM